MGKAEDVYLIEASIHDDCVKFEFFEFQSTSLRNEFTVNIRPRTENEGCTCTCPQGARKATCHHKLASFLLLNYSLGKIEVVSD